MQNVLRHDVLRALFHAEPVDASQLNQPTETELTRAARGSISNAGQINTDLSEFGEKDFSDKVKVASQPKAKKPTSIKKARKSERKRKTAARCRK
jgi:hypothetical protein